MLFLSTLTSHTLLQMFFNQSHVKPDSVKLQSVLLNIIQSFLTKYQNYVVC